MTSLLFFVLPEICGLKEFRQNDFTDNYPHFHASDQR